MSEFTKEEISLCKQVAEGYEFPIRMGAFVYDKKRKRIRINPYKDGICITYHKSEITLPTISDCLEFLRGEGYLVRLVEYERYSGVKTITCYCHGHKTKGAFSKQGNKDEEACLKAVLAVLEEKKK